MKEGNEVQQKKSSGRRKTKRTRNRNKRVTTRKTMVWLFPFILFGIVGFFFIALGIMALLTPKNGTAEVPKSTGIILLACGVAMGLLSGLICCSATQETCQAACQDSCQGACQGACHEGQGERPSSSETPSTPQLLASLDQSQTTADLYSPSAPSGDEFWQPFDENQDPYYPFAPYGHAPGYSYPYGTLQPTAPEMSQCETWLPNSSVPTLPLVATNTESNIRYAAMNSALFPPNLVLNTYLTLPPPASNPSVDYNRSQPTNVNVTVSYTNHL